MRLAKGSANRRALPGTAQMFAEVDDQQIVLLMSTPRLSLTHPLRALRSILRTLFEGLSQLLGSDHANRPFDVVEAGFGGRIRLQVFVGGDVGEGLFPDPTRTHESTTLTLA